MRGGRMINLKRILREIKKGKLVDRLRLTTGNCGCFAIALRHLLNDGDLFDFGHCAHVVLKLGDRYVDGTGIYSLTGIKEQWERWGKGKVHNDEKRIFTDTGNYHTIEEMEEILKLLSEGKSVRKYHVE